ncbi:hypothetical protein [Acidisphaera sp. L21]|uniref:hypothetical protein n=1 Tax=Acidisphaera sp. L21 TaxID=1641851 RepID=UPI00131EA33C|nr:hypothetical protein [Acidisphaera sp. L21]
MRIVGWVLVVLICVVVIGGASSYYLGWPSFAAQYTQSAYNGAPASQGNGAYVPRYSNVRGLQDAPRDDVAQGARIDMQHCLNTMDLRGLKRPVAEHTCEEIIAGISR